MRLCQVLVFLEEGAGQVTPVQLALLVQQVGSMLLRYNYYAQKKPNSCLFDVYFSLVSKYLIAMIHEQYFAGLPGATGPAGPAGAAGTGGL